MSGVHPWRAVLAVAGVLWSLAAGAQTQASCAAYLATDPAPAGIPAVSASGVQQRADFLAQGGKLVAIGSRYYAVYIPPSFYGKANPVVVFNLHGTGGYPEAEWSDWHASMAERGHAFIALAWGGGTAAAATDTEIYAALRQMVTEIGAACPIAAASKWLMGFSVGSAMSFAVMIRDVADQKLFRGQIAVSGAAIGPLSTGRDVMHPTVEANRANRRAVSGIYAWMYCGQQDYDHGWSMCDEMPGGEAFVNEHGGSATLYRDANGQHHSLPTSSDARSAMFAYLEAAAGLGSLALRDAVYLYDTPVNGKGDKILVGADCDVFQLVLDVTSGYTHLAMGQGATLAEALAGQTPYPDAITGDAAMFAYALYGSQAVKSFRFHDGNNPGSSSQIGIVTAFGYCYSAKPGAHVYFRQNDTCTNTYPDGRTTACSVADDGSGSVVASTLTLRDAIYLYGQSLNGRGDKVLVGEGCDVFQLVLDVGSGYTDLAMAQGASLDAALAAASAYPDRIHAAADMFSYALDAGEPVKAFIFRDNTGSGQSAPIGVVTAFGYCYSTQADARVLFRQADSCTNTYSDGHSSAIDACPAAATAPGAPAGLAVTGRNPMAVGSLAISSSSSLQASWTAPAAGTVDHYELTARESIQDTAATVTVTGTATSAVLTGLKAATAYAVTLVACGDAGCGQRSETSTTTATTDAEYWQLQGSGNSVATLLQPVSDGNARLSATRFGAEAGAAANTIQFYYGPRGISGLAVAATGPVSAASPSSYMSFTSHASSSGLRSPAGASSGIQAIMTGQGVPLAAALGARVRLFFEASSADGKTRIHSVDSVDGYVGRDFNSGPATTCSTSADYLAGGGCPATLVIGVEGDAGNAGSRIPAARQHKVGYPTLTDWRWDGAAGAFMVLTVDAISGCTTASHNQAYAIWDGNRFSVQYEAAGCPKLFRSAQAAVPMHIGGSRYKLYFGDPSITTGRLAGSSLPFVGPKKLIYGDGSLTGSAGSIDYEDWEGVGSGRNLVFLWPNGERLGDTAAGYIDDFHVLAPTGSLDLQVLYLTITDGSVTPFAALAVLLNP